MHFTESHEWIRVEGNIGTVGITEYAQNELGEIVYVQLPKVGSEMQAGDEACVLESTKAAADIYSPVSGKIVKINEKLKTNPQELNRSALKEGWLFQIEIDHPKELKKLLTEEQYQKLYQT